MFEKSPFPKLSGKGAEVRDLVKPLLDLWERHMDRGQRVHRQIRLALVMTWGMEQLMDRHSEEVKWPEGAAQEFQDNVLSYLALVTAIATHFHQQGQVLFNVTVKSHYLLHLARFSFFLNPRLAWNYAGEDFMQKNKKIVQGSHKGTAAYQVGNKVFAKYGLGLDFALRDFSDWWR